MTTVAFRGHCVMSDVNFLVFPQLLNGRDICAKYPQNHPSADCDDLMLSTRIWPSLNKITEKQKQNIAKKKTKGEALDFQRISSFGNLEIISFRSSLGISLRNLNISVSAI